MKNILNIYLLFALSCFVFVSCTNEDVAAPTISSFSTQNSPNASGSPGELLKIEGANLSGVQQVILDNKFNVPFNPNLNSDVALFFNIPQYDNSNPYNFGVQPITIVTNHGSIESQINIIQPKPVFTAFSILQPKLGAKVTIKGNWFVGMKSVTFGGKTLDYTLVSEKELYFTVPVDATKGGDVVITTSAGTTVSVPQGPGVTNTTYLDVDLGVITYLYDDFDGNGLYKGTWGTYGDAGAFTATAIGQTGNCAQYDYKGLQSAGYNGCQNNDGKNLLPKTATVASKVTLKMMVNVLAGTSFDIYVDSWAYNFTATTGGWQEIAVTLDKFGSNYNPGNAATDIVKVSPADIFQVKVSFSNNGSTKTIKFDDIKFLIKE